MKLRTPPGRSGRLWIDRRLGVARRGAELLDQKRRVLLAEERRLAELVTATRDPWLDACREAGRWSARAWVLGASQHMALLRAGLSARAEVRVEWERAMGVAYPARAQVELGEAPPLLEAGAPSALHLATAAWRRAIAAGAAHASARRAHERVQAELVLTARRQRVIERRWVPGLEDARHRIELALDEMEREDGVRVRWLKRRAPHGSRG